MSVEIRPNAKTRLADTNIEVSCYGKSMIMINHPMFSAPIPCGPNNDSHKIAEGIDKPFWEKSNTERVESLLSYIDSKIDWEKTPTDAWMHIGKDMAEVRGALADVKADREVNDA